MTDWRRLECECLLQPCPLAKASVNGAISRHKLTGNLSEKHVIELKKQEKKRRMGGRKEHTSSAEGRGLQILLLQQTKKKKTTKLLIPFRSKNKHTIAVGSPQYNSSKRSLLWYCWERKEESKSQSTEA